MLAAGDVPESKTLLGQLSGKLKEFNIWPDNINSVEDIIQWAITLGASLAGIVALFFLIRYGGYEYITSAGNPEQSKKAMQAITQSVIGLVLVLAAYLIITLVLNILSGN